MKVLVTGANGFLGRGVVKRLIELGCEVIATDLNTDCVDKRAVCIEKNVLSLDNPFQVFEKPDVLLHMAWRDGFIHNSEAHIVDLPLHYQFLRKMVDSGIKQIAVIGSMHEVGFHEGCIYEDTTCHPMSLYGISKNALRDMTKILCEQNQVVYQWLRGYYIVANHVNGASIFSKIAKAAQNGEKEFPFTTGKNQYDFVDYDEFCQMVASVVLQKTVTGVIDICSGYPEKLADRVERFITENHYSIRLQYGVYPDRPYDSKAVWGDSHKIRQILENVEKMD